MTLSPCHRASCDAPRCRAGEMVPHSRASEVRRQLIALGWTLVRWRIPKAGRKDSRWGRVSVEDMGGSGRILHLCPEHGEWRPPRGEELPLPSLPRSKAA